MPDVFGKKFEKHRVPKYGAIMAIEHADGDTEGFQGLGEGLMDCHT
jgi:hypothetical protein